MYFSYAIVQWGRVCMGIGGGMGDWEGDGMLAGGGFKVKGFNFKKEIPLNKFLESSQYCSNK